MLIGLTYDLREEYLAAGYGEEETAEFDRTDTIHALDDALRSLGHQTDRIGHVKQLVQRLAGGDRWDLVFNICEGLRGLGREAQVPALLDAYQIPYTFSDASVMAVCLDKAVTKCIVRNAGLPTARFAVVDSCDCLAVPASRSRKGADRRTAFGAVGYANGTASLIKSGGELEYRTKRLRGNWLGASSGKKFDADKLAFPLFAKPIAEGTSKGISAASRIDNHVELLDVCTQLLKRFRQPVLLEEYLPGREMTVGILGTGQQAHCLGAMEILLKAIAEPGVYSYVNKERYEELVEYRMGDADTDDQVRKAQEIALAAWRVLGCRDAGRVDLRCDSKGNPQFMEVNPLAGLHPMHSDLPMLAKANGMNFVELIGQIVDSAATRCTANAKSCLWPNPIPSSIECPIQLSLEER